ncbi:MAG: manganese efflux pump [Lachnospiraceae bacterium]|nr:manganese efflux pump [Lachnospiraceae bacterium]
MGMSFVFIINSIILGVGLAMDAFSVSMANGLHEPYMPKKRMCMIASVYAFFQYAMPMIGWLCVYFIVEIFETVSIYIPWIALILLLYIGGKMLIEGIREKNTASENKSERVLPLRDLLIQGIATSIDALSVGFTLADYNITMANAAALIIAVVTFFISFFGLIIGRKAGMKLSWGASVLGGLILIAIGIEIFAMKSIG